MAKMFSAKDHQIKICVLKFYLEEIDILWAAQQGSVLPEVETQYRANGNEAKKLVQQTRFLKTELQKLNQESIFLTAKRVQLKRQCDELSQGLEMTCKNRDELANSLKQREKEIELQIRQFEDSLHEKTDRFRKTCVYYDDAERNRKLDEVNTVIAKLKSVFGNRQNFVDELKMQLEGIHPEVMEDVVFVFGKPELDEKDRALTAELEALSAKMKLINL